MVFTKEWTVRSEKTLDITEQVEKTVRESGIRTGLVQVETCELASGVLRADRNGDKTLLDTVREMRFLIPARSNFANTESPEHALWQHADLPGSGRRSVRGLRHLFSGLRRTEKLCVQCLRRRRMSGRIL